jgi:hypothetical protein
MAMAFSNPRKEIYSKKFTELRFSRQEAQLAWILDNYGTQFMRVPSKLLTTDLSNNDHNEEFDPKDQRYNIRGMNISGCKNIVDLVKRGLVYCQEYFPKIKSENERRIEQLTKEIEKTKDENIKKMKIKEITDVRKQHISYLEFEEGRTIFQEILEKVFIFLRKKPFIVFGNFTTTLENHFSGTERLILKDARPKKKTNVANPKILSEDIYAVSHATSDATSDARPDETSENIPDNWDD